MSNNRLYAVTDDGISELAIPQQITNLTDLYSGLELGVYSALRTYEHNKFLELDAHLDRTERSMAVLNWDYHLDRDRLKRALHEAVTAFPAPNARVRFDILSWPAESLGTESRELIALIPFKAESKQVYTRGVGIDFVPHLVRDEPLAKTAEFAERRSKMLPSRNRSHYEYLMLDKDDNLLEGTMTNFWVVRNGEVWTAGKGVLEGITRKILLDLIPSIGIPLYEIAVNKKDLPYIDEAFLSGSSRAVVPVVRIAQYEIGDGRPGPISRQILRTYQAYVQENIKTAISAL
ncbi:MAG: aminotransferase class IV [Candidatus Promineifilaceae bacterium]|jgi:branched-chain amino acid aminotransferase